ncbi:MAG: hypothetical protein K9I99_17195, partial [Melioribacteraceae bacterium]|nr:hypothetical protein [Melioribacteraceae bacterium]
MRSKIPLRFVLSGFVIFYKNVILPGLPKGNRSLLSGDYRLLNDHLSLLSDDYRLLNGHLSLLGGDYRLLNGQLSL